MGVGFPSRDKLESSPARAGRMINKKETMCCGSDDPNDPQGRLVVKGVRMYLRVCVCVCVK
jgi:hypothetical protein